MPHKGGKKKQRRYKNPEKEEDISHEIDPRNISRNSANEAPSSLISGKQNEHKNNKNHNKHVELEESPSKDSTNSANTRRTTSRSLSISHSLQTPSQGENTSTVLRNTSTHRASPFVERFIHGQPFCTSEMHRMKTKSPYNFTPPSYYRLPESNHVHKLPRSIYEIAQSEQTTKNNNKDNNKEIKTHIPPQHVERIPAGMRSVKKRLLPSFLSPWSYYEESDSSSSDKEKENGSSKSNGTGWIPRLISLMFTREEFDEEPVNSGVTPEQVRTYKLVDRIVPSFAKRPAFYALDFLTHRRVMLVFLIIAILLGYYNFHEDMTSFTASFIVADNDRPGLRFLENHSIRRKHPVMIIPGFISTALEVWESQTECVKDLHPFASIFRQRMFGPQMLLLLLTDPACYMRLFSLDKETGYDPPGVKVRPDMGFGASDFFLPGYWVWAKVLLNLADIGYDPQSMSVFSYDWRLSPRRMHKRDGYYYYLRYHLLYLYDKNKDRVVLISHSYGTSVILDFFNWMEEREPGWVDKYVAYWINIGGPVLGLPKSVSALLTGDAKDTVTLPSAVRQAFDTHFSRDLRTEVIRTWSCQTAMHPFGCDAAHEDLLTFSNGTRLSAKETFKLTAQRLRESGHKALKEEAEEHIAHFGKLPSLPPTTNTTVFCLYGVDKLTEIGYVLSEDNTINLTYQEQKRTVNGVVLGNGDGTVPLLSLGYMCRAENGWKRNTGRVVTREYKDITVNSLGIRGGAASGDHVDILGNHELIETILKIVSGNAEEGEVDDRIYSDIDERIAKMKDCTSEKS
ncbi:putative phospholipid:diacylglycerol acyltransferase [Trypanosoma theileri]|uniref:Putative phospholipid:diacylglycerol acyltransferase n=1 Tax=Trypanosoma theileri TaxID=67003 RepID=A0A1X0NHY0_9TRYP|nr:putative phospholipid:diacylglycerol acyltransferase [Trypanosoma theileri]ORC84296.1 putative phospholipid:diacylglycerol acyltransferase [Trypanosoma theileri]